METPLVPVIMLVVLLVFIRGAASGAAIMEGLFRPPTTDAGWPPGVQEDDDLRWSWGSGRPAAGGRVDGDLRTGERDASGGADQWRRRLVGAIDRAKPAAIPPAEPTLIELDPDGAIPVERLRDVAICAPATALRGEHGEWASLAGRPQSRSPALASS